MRAGQLGRRTGGWMGGTPLVVGGSDQRWGAALGRGHLSASSLPPTGIALSIFFFFCNLPQAHQLGNQENVWRSTHVPGQLVSQCNAILVYVATGFAGIPKISKIKHFLSKCPSTGNINDIVHPIVHPCFFFKMSTFDKGLSVLVWALVIEN